MGDDDKFEIELRLLLQAIFEQYHYDFRGYACSSLRRRVGQALSSFRCESVSQLQHRVLHEEGVFPRLLQFLTVQVSELFRDPSYWAAVRAHVVPVLRTWPSLKIWIAGVATGEELYSMAILLEEEGLLERTILYATDVNREALRAAEAGIYPVDRLPGFSESYRLAGGRKSLSEYYTAAYGKAVFTRTLRRQVVFSDHDLATDSAFSEMHLVSCRNVLIYFTPPLQDRAIGLFSESLVHGGFLCLGTKETLQFSARAGDYEPVVKRERIFRRVVR